MAEKDRVLMVSSAQLQNQGMEATGCERPIRCP